MVYYGVLSLIRGLLRILWCTFFDKRIVENGWLGGSSIL